MNNTERNSASGRWKRYAFSAAVAGLCSVSPAFASGPIFAPSIIRSTPSQLPAVLLPSTAGIVIPYTAGWSSIRYSIQGSNGTGGAGGCVSFDPTHPPAFSTNSAAPGCASGFAVFAGSQDPRLAFRDGVMPTSGLQAIQPPGGTLSITCELQ